MKGDHNEGMTSKRSGWIALIIMLAFAALTIWGSTPLYRALTGRGRQVSKVPIYNEGTYSATARGYGGDVTVTIKVTEKEIKDVKIEGAQETPEIGGQAVAQLPNIIWKEQSSSIDGVSGATITSNAVKKALNKAMGQAAREGSSLAAAEDEMDELKEDHERLPELEEILEDTADGTYFYEDPEFDESGFKNRMEVVVAGGKITEIKWDAVNRDEVGKRQLSEEGSYIMTDHGLRWYQQADELEAYILENQSTEGLADEEGYADAVSSVSINVSGFLNALKQSLMH